MKKKLMEFLFFNEILKNYSLIAKLVFSLRFKYVFHTFNFSNCYNPQKSKGLPQKAPQQAHILDALKKQGIGSGFDDKSVFYLKCGFCKKLLLYECNSDQLPTFLILSSLLGGCNSKATANPPKSDDRVKKSGELAIVAFVKK